MPLCVLFFFLVFFLRPKRTNDTGEGEEGSEGKKEKRMTKDELTGDREGIDMGREEKERDGGGEKVGCVGCE
jgi:hypothetical protein